MERNKDELEAQDSAKIEQGVPHTKPAMNQSMKIKPLTANDSRIVSDIREMFGRYGSTFVGLVTGKRTDMDALLNFYSAPLRFIGPSFHMVMKDDAAIVGPNGMGGEIDRLRKANFSSSTLGTCDVAVLNDQAALVEAVRLRRDSGGALMEAFAVTYLLAITAGEWRVTSAVDTSKGRPAEDRNRKHSTVMRTTEVPVLNTK